MDEQTQANSRAWDAIAQTHFEKYHIDRLLAGEPVLSEVVRREVGDVAGKSLIHLLCHIGTDTLSWALLGASVIGVDISLEALRYARQLASQMNVDANFIASDVMELAGKTGEKYDIVFASTGVLCWIPDIQRFAHAVRDLLKPGGFFYIHDGHPVTHILVKSETGEAVIKEDYFHKGAWEFDNFIDYTVKDLEIPGKTYEWMWTLGEVVTAFCKEGMRIEFLHEYPQYFYGGYTPFDVENNVRELYPCTFSLKAVVV